MLKLIVAQGLLFFQPPEDAPESGNPAHCDNYAKTRPDHRRARGMQKCAVPREDKADAGMDKRCRTCCRMQHRNSV